MVEKKICLKSYNKNNMAAQNTNDKFNVIHMVNQNPNPEKQGYNPSNSRAQNNNPTSKK